MLSYDTSWSSKASQSNFSLAVVYGTTWYFGVNVLLFYLRNILEERLNNDAFVAVRRIYQQRGSRRTMEEHYLSRYLENKDDRDR